MGTMASQITSLTIVYSSVYSGADERKHQSFPVNSPHKWPVTRKMFPFDDVIRSAVSRSAVVSCEKFKLDIWKTSQILLEINITSIFESCCCSLAVVTHVKYKWDLKDITHAFITLNLPVWRLSNHYSWFNSHRLYEGSLHSPFCPPKAGLSFNFCPKCNKWLRTEFYTYHDSSVNNSLLADPDKNWLATLSIQYSDIYGSGHETAAVLLPGFAINW